MTKKLAKALLELTWAEMDEFADLILGIDYNQELERLLIDWANEQLKPEPESGLKLPSELTTNIKPMISKKPEEKPMPIKFEWTVKLADPRQRPYDVNRAFKEGLMYVPCDAFLIPENYHVITKNGIRFDEGETIKAG